ncbi:secreted RxLR effector protein 161-like [Ipomoea triloba]|uniref:secreted RxLR effector protein 161-like n=1 Tax=Ipomoea triloba TaxID=35885 RepID=UPI00125DC1C6|nr:secreted RxLR effector protein 161-like [Ipomoea triloba]
MGEASYVIGIKIYRDRSQCILGLSHETYINKVLERFRMKDCSPSPVPIVRGDKFSLDQCPKNDFEIESMKNIPYDSVVGCLGYVQVCTRSDIAFAVGMLGRYQSDPGLDFWRPAKKVLRYLKGTKDYKLVFRKMNTLDIVGYSNADFAGCVDSRKSTSGNIFIMVYCDNSAAVFLAKNNKSGSQSKHIDTKYLAIRERVKDAKVVIEHISTELIMITDLLTKGMPPFKFRDFVEKMRLTPTL